jgi:hypothetical protein
MTDRRHGAPDDRLAALHPPLAESPIPSTRIR